MIEQQHLGFEHLEHLGNPGEQNNQSEYEGVIEPSASHKFGPYRERKQGSQS